MNWILNSLTSLRRVFLEKVFPNEFIENDLLIRPDGNISAGFVCKFPEQDSLGETDMLMLQQKLEEVFSRLPEGTTIHFQSVFYFADAQLKALEETQAYLTGRMREHLTDSPVLSQQAYLWLCFNNKGSKPRSVMSTFFSSLWAGSGPLEGVEASKIKINNQVQAFLTNVSAVQGFSIKRLSNNGIKSAHLRYLNLDFNQAPTGLNNEISCERNTIRVGDKIAQTVYLARAGNQLFRTHQSETGMPAFMPWPLGVYLNFPHIVNLSFRIGGEADLKKLDDERKSRMSLGKMMSQVDRQVIEDIEAFTGELRTQNKKIVMMNHNVLVWGYDRVNVSLNCDRVVSAYIRMNDSHAIKDGSNAGNYYFTYSPGYALDSFNTLRVSLEDALLHVDFSRSTPSDQDGYLFCNREHQPVLVDLYSPRLNNKNRIVIGPTGSGKSFLLNTIEAQSIDKKTEVIIIDVGDKAGSSYQNIVSFFKGSHYQYSEGNPFRANPFIIDRDVTGRFDLSAEKKTFLLSVIQLLWKDSGVSLSREEEAILSDLLDAYYIKVNDKTEVPRLDRFVDFVDYTLQRANDHKTKFFNLESFKLVLSKYISGAYRHVFCNDVNERISDNRLILFDLFGLKADPSLFPVVSLLIIETIMDKIRANPSVKKEILFDESWSILSGAIGDFIEVLYRTVRKSNGSVTIITQTIIELSNSKIGPILRGNAATVLLLNHNSAGAMLPTLQSFFALSDGQIALLKSMREGDTWREFMLIRNGVAQVFIADVGPHAGAAFSTTPRVRTELEALTKKGGAEYAINQYVENHSLV